MIQDFEKPTFFILCLFVALTTFFLAGHKAFRLIELNMLDYRFQLRGRTDISKDIVLVSIGHEDIELLGRWPWPRKYHSDLIQILNSYGVKVIGYDVLFNEADKYDPDSDLRLASIAKETGNVFFPMAFSGKEGDQHDLLPVPPLYEASSGVGFVNLFSDEDGIVRRTPLRLEGRSAFGLGLAMRFLEVPDNGIVLIPQKSLNLHLPDGDRITIPLDRENRMLVNYAGRTEDWKWVHFVQIILAFMEEDRGETPTIDLSLFRDKIVVVGTTYTGIPDIIETPFGISSYGLEFHASVINSLLQRNFIRPLPSWADILIYFLITLGTAFLVHVLRPLKGGIVSVAILLCFIGVSYVLFSRFHVWIKLVRPVTGFVTIYFTGLIYHFIRVRKAFQHYVEEESQLREITSDIASELGLDALLAKIVSATTEMLEAERSSLFLFDPETDELYSKVAEHAEIMEIRFPASLGIAGACFTSGHMLNIPDSYADQRFHPEVDFKTGYRTKNILCVPVVSKEGRKLGVIEVLNKKDGTFSSNDEKRLKTFSAQVSIALENAQKIALMSTIDELTGLYNRRYFFQVLEQEMYRAKRYNMDLILCMIEPDQLKKINEMYGYSAVEMVFCELGNMLRDGIRKSDLVCHYGKGEFAVILPYTRKEEAQVVFKRFSERLSGHQFRYSSFEFQVTVRMGIASYQESTEQSPTELIALAKKALCEAKEVGGDRVV